MLRAAALAALCGALSLCWTASAQADTVNVHPFNVQAPRGWTIRPGTTPGDTASGCT